MTELGLEVPKYNLQRSVRVEGLPIDDTERTNFIAAVQATAGNRPQRVRDVSRTSEGTAAGLLMKKTVDAGNAEKQTLLAVFESDEDEIELSITNGVEISLGVFTQDIVRTKEDQVVITREKNLMYEIRPEDLGYDESITYSSEGFQIDDYVPQEGDNLFGLTLDEAKEAVELARAKDDQDMDQMLGSDADVSAVRIASAEDRVFTVGRYNEAMAFIGRCTDETFLVPR
jgi:hypothetical protein